MDRGITSEKGHTGEAEKPTIDSLTFDARAEANNLLQTMVGFFDNIPKKVDNEVDKQIRPVLANPLDEYMERLQDIIAILKEANIFYFKNIQGKIKYGGKGGK